MAFAADNTKREQKGAGVQQTLATDVNEISRDGEQTQRDEGNGADVHDAESGNIVDADVGVDKADDEDVGDETGDQAGSGNTDDDAESGNIVGVDVGVDKADDEDVGDETGDQAGTRNTDDDAESGNIVGADVGVDKADDEDVGDETGDQAGSGNTDDAIQKTTDICQWELSTNEDDDCKTQEVQLFEGNVHTEAVEVNGKVVSEAVLQGKLIKKPFVNESCKKGLEAW